MSRSPYEKYCIKCNNNRVILREDRDEYIPCPHCVGLHSVQADSANYQTLLRCWRQTTFATFSPHEIGTLLPFTAAKSYCANPLGWFVLLGPTGCGKTHLALAIANELAGLGHKVYVEVVPSLMMLFHASNERTTMSPRPMHTLMRELMEAPVLILDDFGAEHLSPWTQDRMYLILNERYNLRLPTIITTNLPEEQITDRLISRMIELSYPEHFIRMQSKDYRRRKYA